MYINNQYLTRQPIMILIDLLMVWNVLQAPEATSCRFPKTKLLCVNRMFPNDLHTVLANVFIYSL